MHCAHTSRVCWGWSLLFVCSLVASVATFVYIVIARPSRCPLGIATVAVCLVLGASFPPTMSASDAPSASPAGETEQDASVQPSLEDQVAATMSQSLHDALTPLVNLLSTSLPSSVPPGSAAAMGTTPPSSSGVPNEGTGEL